MAGEEDAGRPIPFIMLDTEVCCRLAGGVRPVVHNSWYMHIVLAALALRKPSPFSTKCCSRQMSNMRAWRVFLAPRISHIAAN